jgi:hypothetical protein
LFEIPKAVSRACRVLGLIAVPDCTYLIRIAAAGFPGTKRGRKKLTVMARKKIRR